MSIVNTHHLRAPEAVWTMIATLHRIDGHTTSLHPHHPTTVFISQMIAPISNTYEGRGATHPHQTAKLIGRAYLTRGAHECKMDLSQAQPINKKSKCLPTTPHNVPDLPGVVRAKCITHLTGGHHLASALRIVVMIVLITMTDHQ